MSTVSTEPVVFHDYYPAANGRGLHALDTHQVRAILTSSVPVMQSNAVLANLSEVATGGGYTAGGVVCTVTPPASYPGGVYRLAITNIPQWTASGSGFSFYSLVLVNWTATAKNLIEATFESTQGYVPITNVSQSGTTATLTIAGHGWSNGNTIVTDAVKFPQMNGTFTISGVTTDTVSITVATSATIASTALTLARAIRPGLNTLTAGQTYQASAGSGGALAIGPYGVDL